MTDVTQSITNQKTQITIFAAVNDANTVTLFLANTGVDLQSTDTVQDDFTESGTALVTILSTAGKVVVNNKDGSDNPQWSNDNQTPVNGISIYWASASIAVPEDEGNPFTDRFNITVNGFSTDPTVIIDRTG